MSDINEAEVTLAGLAAMDEHEGMDGMLDDCPVVSAIAAVMGEVGSVGKGGTNKFHNYKFAEASDVVAKLQPLMSKYGLVPIQTEIDKVFLDEGNVLSITYGFHLTHKSGCVLMTVNEQGDAVPLVIRQTGMSGCRNSKHGFDDKAANKCHTAARKYFLISLFQIPTVSVDDADAEQDVGGGRKAAEAPVKLLEPPRPEAAGGPPVEIAMGSLTPMQWGAKFVTAIRQAKSDHERQGWQAENQTTLAAIKAGAPLIYERIEAHLKPSPLAVDPLVKTLGETFALCNTRKALDNVWKTGVADKGYAPPLLDAITAEFQKHEARVKTIN